MSRTLLIIKPDAVERNLIGHIVSRLEQARFKIVAMRMMPLSKEEAREFYAVHKEKSFYTSAGGVHDFRPGSSDGPGKRERD